MSDAPEEGHNEGTGGEDLPIDAVLGLLANPRRRILLLYFVNQLSDAADVDDLCEFVHRWEAESDGEVSRDEIRDALRDTHLPTLADAGVIEYDEETAIVEYLGSDRLEQVHTSVRRGLDP